MSDVVLHFCLKARPQGLLQAPPNTIDDLMSDLEPECYRTAAAALDRACAAQSVLPPFSASHPEMSTTDGYAIQRAWADLRAERGERLVGYKVGFTSKSMQRTYNVDKPLVGRLFDSMMWKTGDSLDSRHFYKPHVEVELAFIMGRDLACGAVTLAAVLAATAFIQPALELIDYRTGMPRSIADMVADNTACAGAVLGGQRIPPAQLDLTWIAATIAKNGEIEETGVSAAVLGHPARAVVALSDQLALEQCHIKAGDIILSGSFTPMIAVAGGDVVHADFGQLGSIDLTLA